jgi:hypothetical protein
MSATTSEQALISKGFVKGSDGEWRKGAQNNNVAQRRTCGIEKPPPEAKARRRGRMNRTEERMAAVLESEKASGKILRFEFEGITLRFAGTPEHPPCSYTPDFAVFDAHGLRFVEVKGSHVFGNAVLRFKGARAAWPEFRFEMWQWSEGAWSRLH